MTPKFTARFAGFMFLFYIASGIIGMIFFDEATKGADAAAKLASIATHRPQMSVAFIFALIGIFNALALGLALYSLTRATDPDLALLALIFRVVEGAINAIPAVAILALVSFATTAVGSESVAGLLLNAQVWSVAVGATVFAIGSAVYSYLFLRARSIPVWLAWLGLGASLQLAVTAPAAGLGFVRGAGVGLMWLPMLIFEVTLGLLLLVRGTLAHGRAAHINTIEALRAE
jgi:hypothetical protein